MTKMIQCSVLKREAEAMSHAPYPGELGERILKEVSAEGWKLWLQRQVMLINEYQLNSADPKALTMIEKDMVGFLFGEGDGGGPPAGYQRG